MTTTNTALINGNEGESQASGMLIINSHGDAAVQFIKIQHTEVQPASMGTPYGSAGHAIVLASTHPNHAQLMHLGMLAETAVGHL